MARSMLVNPLVRDATRVIAVMLGVSLMLPCGGLAQQMGDFGDNCTSSACHGGLVRGKSVHVPARDNQCDACHEQSDAKAHQFERVSDVAELCLDCHDDPAEDAKFEHGPVAAGACTSCHNPHASEYPKLLVETGPKLCAQCHDEVFEDLEDLESTHPPVREDCLTCHQPHGGDNKMFLTSVAPELCFDCHDDVADTVDDATVAHAPVTEGRACLSCHSPHASGNAHLLLGAGARLCLTCHNRTMDAKRGTIANIADRLAKHGVPHGPVADNDCVACHRPHGGENARLLVNAYPMKRYIAFDEEAYALCFECHDAEAFDEAYTADATEFRDGERNLHFLHVRSSAKGRTCRFCHDPHASSNKHQVTDSVAFGEWRLPLDYKATQTGGSCAPGCHQPRQYDRVTPVAPRRATPSAEANP